MIPKVLRGICHAALTIALVATIASSASGAQAGGVAKPEFYKKMLRDKTIPAASVESFDAYFNTILSKFASTRPSVHDDLPAVRKELKTYLRAGNSGDAHDHLNKLTLDKLKPIVVGTKYDAAAKYNAMLMIAELNEQEDAKPCKPLASTLPVLLFTLKRPAFKDEVKVAALLGLERFAVTGAIPADQKVIVTGLMLDLLTKPSPPNRSADGQHWMRRSSAQILASLGSPGTDNNVVKAFEAILVDPTARPTLRCDVARFLGQLKYPAGTKLDYQALAAGLGHQVVDICKHEIEAAKSAPRGIPSRRLLASAVFSATEGLEGTDSKGGLWAAAAGTDNQKTIDEMRAKLKSLQTLIEDKDETPDDSLALIVGDKITELESALPPRAVKAVKENVADPAKQPEAARAAVDGIKVNDVTVGAQQ